MFDALRHDEQFSGPERHGAVAKLDVEHPVEHQKQIVRVVMLVPDELALNPDEADVIVVVSRDDPRRPMVRKRLELRRQIDLAGHQ